MILRDKILHACADVITGGPAHQESYAPYLPYILSGCRNNLQHFPKARGQNFNGHLNVVATAGLRFMSLSVFPFCSSHISNLCYLAIFYVSL